MEIPTRQDLQDLLHQAKGDVVSIYLPTHRGKVAAPHDPSVLKNLLNKAEEELLKRGHTSVTAGKQLDPARALLSDLDFWTTCSEGLAIFLAPGLLRVFRAPTAFDELVMVAGQFYIIPLLPLIEEDHPFFVLAISQKHVRLLRGTRFGQRVVNVEGLPQNIVDALNYQPPQRLFQVHLLVRGPTGIRMKSVHAQAGASDYVKDEALEFFRLIDKALHPFLREKSLPLVFAGVDYLYPIYCEANSYPHLAEVHVHGSPDLMSEHELHRLAWEVLQPHFERPVHDALRRACQQSETDPAIYDLRSVLRGAYEGRVDTLLLARGQREWGTFHPQTEEVRTVGTPSNESEELLNRVAIETLLRGGKVYLVERAQMPRESVLAALYRYGAVPQDVAATTHRGPR